MTDKNKLMLGGIIIIGVMILSYKVFPRDAEYDQGFKISDEISELEEQIKGIGQEDEEETPYMGIEECTTLEECVEYCSLPENETQCSEILLPSID